MSEHEPIPLAPRDYLILLVLAEGPTHGYGVVTAAERTTSAQVPLDPANLYRALRRMLRDGWVSRMEGEGDRTAFELTARGREILRAETHRLDELLRRARPLLLEER